MSNQHQEITCEITNGAEKFSENFCQGLEYV